MSPFKRASLRLGCFLLALFAQLTVLPPAFAQPTTVSIFIVRHAEADNTQPTIPLSKKGMERAALLGPTLQAVKFTHLFATHTTRARQMLDGISASSGLPIVQLPAPGSLMDGKPVNDQTTRRAPIEPMGEALLNLPAGSTALLAANSENIFAILNKLGVPVASGPQGCARGSMCVPCTDNSCYPRSDYGQLWHVVRVPGRTDPIAFAELRYAEGFGSADK